MGRLFYTKITLDAGHLAPGRCADKIVVKVRQGTRIGADCGIGGRLVWVFEGFLGVPSTVTRTSLAASLRTLGRRRDSSLYPVCPMKNLILTEPPELAPVVANDDWRIHRCCDPDGQYKSSGSKALCPSARARPTAPVARRIGLR
jgi:hypothetical protein